MHEVLAALARQALVRAGLPVGGLEPVRVHSNAVFRLTGLRMIVRVGSGLSTADRARGAVAVTRWLAGMGFPTVVPVDVAQPVVLTDDSGLATAVTFWHQVDIDEGRLATPAELGGLLRDLHRLPAPPFAVPAFRPLDRLVAAVESSTWLSAGNRSWLLDRAAALQAAVGALADMPAGLVHGDAQLGNVLPVAGGAALLGDWDGVTVAPRCWDLVPTAVEPRFGGRHSMLAEVLATYGSDPAGGPGWAVLQDVYELRSVAAHIRRAPVSPPHAAEATLRIASLRAGDQSVRWHAVG